VELSDLFLSDFPRKHYMQKLILKKKSKRAQEQRLSSSQKLALHAIQKQMQLLKLKEWLIIAGFAVGGCSF